MLQDLSQYLKSVRYKKLIICFVVVVVVVVNEVQLRPFFERYNKYTKNVVYKTKR